MNMLIDIFPIIVFFTVYKFWGIYVATGAAIAVAGAQLCFVFIRTRKIKPLQLITFAVLFVLGGITILLHNPIFIKWKPSIVYWLFAVAFMGTQLFSKKPLIQYVMGAQLELPQKIWTHLNISWVLFFIIMGIANLYVVYHYSTNSWVNFKLFGILGLTIIFILIQALYLSRFLPEKVE